MATEAESDRLGEDARRERNWRRWGPYLAERQWGTAREDYSPHGECWTYFPHDHARSRAYRWGEDGLLGFSDREGRLCFAVALWNGADPILKERLFGLTGPEGNHGEDVKECYYYLDATPTHSYNKALYKYPQRAYPYAELVAENARRGKDEPEYELADTGVFDDDRYFDVQVEYAKAAADDVLVRLTVANRGPERATLHLLPTLWFRNTWSWGRSGEKYGPKPSLSLDNDRVRASHWSLGDFELAADRASTDAMPSWLLTENDTNVARLFGAPNAQPFVKDAFHAYVIDRRHDAVNLALTGTKACAYCEADAFYRTRIPEALTADEQAVARQAYAGLLWSKQFYHYAVGEWIEGDPAQPPPPTWRMRAQRGLAARLLLGLDNIGVFDRSQPLPTGGHLEQADGTAWMAFFCGAMLSMALELASEDPSYEDVASKFFEHFVAITDAMNSLGGTGLWDEPDGFYYDQLHVNGDHLPLRVRSMVGLIPLFACEVVEQDVIAKLPGFAKRMRWFLENRPELARYTSYMQAAPGDDPDDVHAHRLLAIPSKERLTSVLRYLLDETEFLSRHGVRSVSRVHAENPYIFRHGSEEFRVQYDPAESTSGLFGGNSNWRGPVWFPVNYLLVEALERYDHFYGDTLRVECPVQSGRMLSLGAVATELSSRLSSLFVPDARGHRACHAGDARYARDPHWRDLVLFHEYFDGDTGRGVGASHQTGWTALVVRCLENVARSRTVARPLSSRATAKRQRGISRASVVAPHEAQTEDPSLTLR